MADTQKSMPTFNRTASIVPSPNGTKKTGNPTPRFAPNPLHSPQRTPIYGVALKKWKKKRYPIFSPTTGVIRFVIGVNRKSAKETMSGIVPCNSAFELLLS